MRLWCGSSVGELLMLDYMYEVLLAHARLEGNKGIVEITVGVV